MTAMAVYGSMYAVVAPGARIARDRSRGWTRQLRITPLRARTDLTAKVAAAYLLALPTVALLYLAGASLGVRLDAAEWLEMTGLFVARPGSVRGDGIRPWLSGADRRAGGCTGRGGRAVRVLGGVFGFQLATSGPLFVVLKGLPSYWLVQAGKGQHQRGQLARAGVDRDRGVDRGADTSCGAGLPSRNEPGMSHARPSTLRRHGRYKEFATPAEAEWVATQRRWTQGRDRFILSRGATALPDLRHWRSGPEFPRRRGGNRLHRDRCLRLRWYCSRRCS